MAESPAVAHAAQGTGHASIKTYINVAVALTILTAIEVASLYIPGIPNWLLVSALIVMAALKFFLVVGFFMHLRYDSNIMRALFSAFILLPRPH